MEFGPLIDSLAPELRLALAYAPRHARAPSLALLALDARLGAIVRGAREPMLGQLRLAWWREQLDRPVHERAPGEPLLALLAGWQDEARRLGRLAEGWEAMLGEGPLDGQALEELADARAEAFAALAATLGHGADPAVRPAARVWALAELAGRLSHPEERGAALELARGAGQGNPVLPRALRPLAVLRGLGRRAVRRGGAGLLDGPGALPLAIRLGFLGR